MIPVQTTNKLSCLEDSARELTTEVRGRNLHVSRVPVTLAAGSLVIRRDRHTRKEAGNVDYNSKQSNGIHLQLGGLPIVPVE